MSTLSRRSPPTSSIKLMPLHAKSVQNASESRLRHATGQSGMPPKLKMTYPVDRSAPCA
jgi:hypothetical protein